MASIKQIQLNGVDYNLVDADTLAALDNHIGNAIKYNYYGVCSTAAGTAAKTVTVDNSFKLVTGVSVTIKFSDKNSASNPTLNVNGTGAKPLYRYGTTVVSTATTTSGWIAGSVQTFTYDGTGWVRDYWNNTTYSNASLGQGYGVCSTAAATAAKTVSISSYALTDGGIVSIKFNNAVPANATLNITSKGAKPIKYRGAAITAGVISAGDTASFIYEADDTSYHLISVDKARITEDDIIDALGFYPSETDTTYSLKVAEWKDSDAVISLIPNNGLSTYAAEPEDPPEPVQSSFYKYIKTTDGQYWVPDYASQADTLTHTLSIKKGGTGAYTAEDALRNFGLTATATELNYCDGVTSNIQNQLNDLDASKVNHIDELIIDCGTSTINIFN